MPSRSLILVIFLTSFNTLAIDFKGLVYHAQNSCPRLHCAGNPVTLSRPFKGSEINSVQKSKLLKIASPFFKKWEETILERDLWAQPFLVIDSLEILYFQNQPIGYRFTYSAKAWDLSTCDFRPSTHLPGQTPPNCVTGRIRESAFVAAEFGHFAEIFVDRFAQAKFLH